MRNRILLAIVGAVLLSNAPALGLTYVPVSDAALADGADLIAYVALAAGEVAEVEGRVVTRYQATALDLVKGRASGSQLVITVPGGIEPAGGRRMLIPGMPTFRPGERALVFLGRSANDTYRLLHLSLGAFREVETGGGPILLRNLTESWELGSPPSAPFAPTLRPGRDLVRDRQSFSEWLRDRGQGIERPSDYLIDLPAAEITGLNAKFTLLGPKNLTGRWFVFDEGRGLRWFRHGEGQPGLAGRGRKEFKRALKAWNKTRTPIRLVNAGASAGTGGFVRTDGHNTILFRDVNESIGSDFDCASGGVLAIGGLSDFSAALRDYKNLGVFEAFEAEIVVNDGVECLFSQQPRIAAQVYAHELGHTLGLGHSCGDGASPRCERSDLLAEALMRASLSKVIGAQLADDDRAGIRMLYDDEFFAQPCDDTVPGARRFCRRCGPCGVGQGNCRDDRDCVGILECAKDVGDLFGFDPSTNVCVEP